MKQIKAGDKVRFTDKLLQWAKENPNGHHRPLGYGPSFDTSGDMHRIVMKNEIMTVRNAYSGDLSLQGEPNWTWNKKFFRLHNSLEGVEL